MKFSFAWLQTWLSQEIAVNDLVEKLTMAGLEVDACEPVANDFSRVVVGKVLSTEPHPDADRLTVCQVDVKTETLTIVCGAKNVAADMLVPVATIGGHVGDLKIKKTKLRGVESFGMICSAKELGLADSSEGILSLDINANLGEDIREILQLNDFSIDVDLTPNRGDCLGLEGLARDISALEAIDFKPLEVKPVAAKIAATFPVDIHTEEGCGQYVGRVIKNVDVSKSTPAWMQEYLRRSGIRTIDPIVDITNYVMLELGQPLHAFDLANLSGGIVVRMAKPSETLTLLDGKTIELNDDCLVIADETRSLALAGVMGGEDSGVNEHTKDIFLESAYFNPEVIAGRARRFGLHTDSSHRFERGVDPQLQERAAERATQLITEIVGGEAGPIIKVGDEKHIPQKRFIYLRTDRISRVLGMTIERQAVKGIFQRLGFTVKDLEDGFDICVPTYRFDVHLEVDLIEEIARVHGYEKIPTELPYATLTMQHQPEAKLNLNHFRESLVADGFREIISYSFVDPKLQQLMNPHQPALSLANPLSPELSQMRSSLWPGLIQALKYNQYRQVNRIKIFESGLRFVVKDTLYQQPVIAGAICGSKVPEQWSVKAESMDFYDLKNTLEKMFSLTHDLGQFRFIDGEHPALHPGQTAEILKDGQSIGYCGRLHPKLESSIDIRGPIYLFELDLRALSNGVVPTFQSISKYPSIRRDLALVVSEAVPAQSIVDTISQNAGSHLADIHIFDQYQGAGIETGQKSIALGITLRDLSRTLTEDEVSATINKIIKGLESLGATLRE